jgi:glycosyltransferase involved in cell wall biosynthesis
MFSVVVPLYNKGQSIRQALESILDQTFSPSEIIVVDDGSTDNGPEVVREFIEQGVRLVGQSNQGVSAARNLGLSLSKYKYIAFLDADDLWLPGHLESVRGLILTHPQAALFSTAHVIRRQGRYHRPYSRFPDEWQGLVPDFFQAYSKGLGLVNSSTAVVHRAALVQVGGFPVGIHRGEDVIVWSKLALLYPVAHVETVTAIYDQQAENRTDRICMTEPPGSLSFLADLLNKGGLTAVQRAGVMRLFDRIAFFTASGLMLNGDRLGSLFIRDLALECDRNRTAVAISCISFMPAWLLKLARNLRHRKANKNMLGDFRD